MKVLENQRQPQLPMIKRFRYRLLVTRRLGFVEIQLPEILISEQMLLEIIFSFYVTDLVNLLKNDYFSARRLR